PTEHILRHTLNSGWIRERIHDAFSFHRLENLEGQKPITLNGRMHVIEKHASAWNAMFRSGFDEDFEIDDRNMAFRGYAHQDCADCGGSPEWTDGPIPRPFVSGFFFGEFSQLL